MNATRLTVVAQTLKYARIQWVHTAVKHVSMDLLERRRTQQYGYVLCPMLDSWDGGQPLFLPIHVRWTDVQRLALTRQSSVH